MNKSRFERAINLLPPNPKILDAGCGNGSFSSYVKLIRPDAELYGVDIDDQYAQILSGILKFYKASVDSLNMFPDSFFHTILCFHLIEHLSMPQKAVYEFHRVLMEDGIILAETPHWLTTLKPLGFNFYDDPTHVRPYNRASLQRLFYNFEINYLKVETSAHVVIADLRNERRPFLKRLIHKILSYIPNIGTVIFLIGKKR